MTECTCTSDTIDGYDVADLKTWELALRNAAHGHYPLAGMESAVLPDAVKEIDRLRMAIAARGWA